MLRYRGARYSVNCLDSVNPLRYTAPRARSSATMRFAFSLSRIYDYFQGKPFAIVSAYLSDDDRNEARADALKSEVRKLGYGYREIKGALGRKRRSAGRPGPHRVPPVYSGDRSRGCPRAGRSNTTATIAVCKNSPAVVAGDHFTL